MSMRLIAWSGWLLLFTLGLVGYAEAIISRGEFEHPAVAVFLALGVSSSVICVRAEWRWLRHRQKAVKEANRGT